MSAPKPAADAMTPYQLPFPKEAQKEIVVDRRDSRPTSACGFRKPKTSGSARCA